MAQPRFLVPAVAPDARAVDLPHDEAHHAFRVLRLGRGDAVRVFDGAGREWAGHVTDAGAKRVEVALDHAVDPAREPAIDVTLAIGLLKGDQMDTAVREGTALGVAAIVPVVSTRVVAPARARVAAAHARWRRVAVQSAKQCGRAVVPRLDEPAAFADVIADRGFEVRVMLAEPQSGGAIDEHPPLLAARSSAADGSHTRGRALILIGPEGGWTADEVQQAVASGIALWRLGPRTLRAELAPTVALAALWARWGW